MGRQPAVCRSVPPAAQFTNMRNILLSPLPRVYAYEVGPNGQETGGVVPTDEETRPIGQNVHIDRITAACQEMKRRLKTEVLAPWRPCAWSWTPAGALLASSLVGRGSLLILQWGSDRRGLDQQLAAATLLSGPTAIRQRDADVLP